MPRHLLSACCLFMLLTAHAQTYQWGATVGGTGQEIAFATTVDGQGSVITTGSYTGTVDLDPGPGVANVTSTIDSDVFIQKLDISGQFLWGGSITGSGADQGLGIDTDGQGNVYITGRVSGTVDLDPGTGVVSATTPNTAADAFVVKLNASGAFQWGRIIGGTSNDIGRGIAVDAAGNSHITGSLGNASDIDPGPGVFTAGGNGGTDIFVVKLDANGLFLWGAAAGGSVNDVGHGVALSPTGDVHVAGEFRNTADFDPSAGTLSLVSAGAEDIVAWKLSSTGALVWARRAGGTSLERAKAVAVDFTGASVYTGQINSTTDMDPGPGVFNLTGNFTEPAYVWKLDANGDFVWAFILTSFLNEGRSIDVDPSGNIVLTGTFGSTMDIDPGPAVVNIVASGAADPFLLGYSPAGTLLFGVTLGSAQNDSGHGIALGPDGTVHVVGQFLQTIDLDPGPGTSLFFAQGSADAFIGKYGKPDCIGVLVSAKAFLGGPYNSADQRMDDALRSDGLIPLQEPYSAMGLVPDDSAVATTPLALSWTGLSAPVDWVLLELRDATVPDSVIARRAALIQRDGDIVSVDGVSPVSFCTAAGPYHVAVRHRNHLGIQTAAPITLVSTTPNVVNFTLASTATFGTDARQDVNGVQVLWPGNTVADALVKYIGATNDRDPILVRIGGTVPTLTVDGYWPEDVNLDGTVKYTGAQNDRDVVLLTIGGTVPTVTRTEQLP